MGQPGHPDGWQKWINGAGDLCQRLLTGDHEVDESGLDPEFVSSVFMPLFRPLYQKWFRVQMRGIENVPASGAALVVANHSGVLPFDALMLQAGLFDEHPQQRNLRVLSADLLYEVPVLSDLARRSGHIRADREQAEQALAAGELVGVFPEGFKGIGKPFSERYRLQRFGRGGFATTARRAGVPIIPCAIVGAEEIYPMIGNSRSVARLLQAAVLPAHAAVPVARAGRRRPAAVQLDHRVLPAGADGRRSANGTGPDQAVRCLADRVRDIIQHKLDQLVAERGPAFS